jgi:hypothetical protein
MFFKLLALSDEEYQQEVVDRWQHVVPGSRPQRRQPRDGPAAAGPPANQLSGGGPAVADGSDTARHKALIQNALEKVDQVARTVDSAIAMNDEGIYRSQYRIGLYEALEAQEEKRLNKAPVQSKPSRHANERNEPRTLSDASQYCTSLISVNDQFGGDHVETSDPVECSDDRGPDTSSGSVEITDWEMKAAPEEVSEPEE